MNGWQMAALAVQVLGLIVTARGIRKTWVAHPTGEPFMAPVMAAVKTTSTRVEQTAQRVLRRPNRATLNASLPVLTGTVTITAEGHVWAALPTDPEAFRREVNAHLSRLTLESIGHTKDLAMETTTREQAVATVEAALNSTAAGLRAEVHQAASEGLREQALGVGLVAIGLVFQVLAGG